MKGAVQGVATSTASKPVKKLPAWPCRLANRPPTLASGVPTWNTPDRFNPTPNSSHAMAATKIGEANWNPHPAADPAARAASKAAARPAKVTSTPAV